MRNTAKRNHIKQGRMVIVAELYKRGWSIEKIAREIRTRLNTTCSTRTIWNDIQSLLEEWRAVRIEDVDQRLQLELERIDDAVRELWEQWDKSKEDWLRENNKLVGVPHDGGENETVTIRREKRSENVVGLGNPAYMAEIRQQLAERRKLLGLYAATKSELTGKDGAPLIPVEKMSEEEIYNEIERMRKSRSH